MQKKITRESIICFSSKIECSIAFISSLIAVFYLFGSKFIIKLSPLFRNYFTAEIIDEASTFFSITVAVYITVITIISTSVIGISREILQNNLDNRLITTIIWGMSESIVAAGLSAFVDSSALIFLWLLFTLNLVAVVSFVKFIRILLIIFKKNLEIMAISIDAEDSYKNDLLTHIEDIADYCRENKKPT